MDKEQAKCSQENPNDQPTNSRCKSKSRRDRKKRVQQRREAGQCNLKNIAHTDSDIQIHYTDQLNYFNILKTLPPKLQSVPCQTLPIPNIDLNTVANEMEPPTISSKQQKSNIKSPSKSKNIQQNLPQKPKPTVPNTKQNEKKTIKPTLQEGSKSEGKIDNAVSTKENDISLKTNNQKKAPSTIPSSNENINKEKSREEILAEREAKKAAKQAKKLGKTADKPNDKPNEIKQKVSENSVNTENNKTDNNKIPETNEHKEKNDKMKEVPEVESKSKAELRAERRQKQEAQRAAKAAALQAKSALETTTNKSQSVPGKTEVNNVKKPKPSLTEKEKTDKTKPVKKISPQENQVKLFAHLYKQRESLNILNSSDIHPAMVKLGVQYAHQTVIGSNARCVALLYALKQVINDYKTPPEKEFSRGLESYLQNCITYLNQCRPISVSMRNVMKHLKWQLTQLPNSVTDSDAKRKLDEALEIYIREQIYTADEAISNTVLSKISNGDVILTYGCSSLVHRILIEAHKSGKKFRVMVVDASPWHEGRELIRRLIDSGLDCTYVLISTVNYIMREVSKVLLGAHALLANGCVMSRAKSAEVALAANTCNVPILVCCETHKFSERVYTDSFVYNEIGNPGALKCSEDSVLSNSRNLSKTLLNLTYDVTPPNIVTAVVTELAILPCTSVPVILRIKPSEIGC